MSPKPKPPKRKRSIPIAKVSLAEIHENVSRFVLVCQQVVETAHEMRIANHILMENGRTYRKTIAGG